MGNSESNLRLYACTVSVDVVVLAASPEEAKKVANWASRQEPIHTVRTPRQVKTPSQLPRDWTTGCLPWYNFSLSDPRESIPISEWLAKKPKHETKKNTAKKTKGVKN